MRIAAVPALTAVVLIAAGPPTPAQAPAASATPSPAANGNLDLRSAPQAPIYKLLRYDEDWSFLRNPSQRHDLWDPLKYVPLNPSGSAYVPFGGEARERFEYHSVVAFGHAPASKDGYFLQRCLLHADARFGRMPTLGGTPASSPSSAAARKTDAAAARARSTGTRMTWSSFSPMAGQLFPGKAA